MPELVWIGGFAALLGMGAVYDGLTRRLPNWLALVLLVYGLAHGFALAGWSGLGWHAAHMAIALLAGMAVFAMGIFGGGDAKFYAGMAAFFPLSQALDLLLWVSIVAIVTILVWMIGRRIPPFKRFRKDEGDFGKFPYGVAMAFGGVAAAWLLTLS